MNDYDRLVTALRNDATDNTRLLNENAMLEADNKTLTAKLEQAEAELKRAVEDLYLINFCPTCSKTDGVSRIFCKHYKSAKNPSCCDNYEWRGAKQC